MTDQVDGDVSRHPKLTQIVTRVFPCHPSVPPIQHCMPFICAGKVSRDQAHAGTKPARYWPSAALNALIE
jgi:hypothetical protein